MHCNKYLVIADTTKYAMDVDFEI